MNLGDREAERPQTDFFTRSTVTRGCRSLGAHNETDPSREAGRTWIDRVGSFKPHAEHVKDRRAHQDSSRGGELGNID